jgi:hypothetical protein
MKTFIFKMNEYGNVCYVYVDSTKPPIDTLYLIEGFNASYILDTM